MKLNLTAICQNDLQGNTLEVNLLYSAYLLARARKKAFWGNVSAVLHMLSVFAGGWGWVIYGCATGVKEITDIPRLIWLSIIILPIIPFLLDIIFAIIEKIMSVRRHVEPLSDDDLSANLNYLVKNLKKAETTTHVFDSITYVGTVGFTCVTALFVLWIVIQEAISSPKAESAWLIVLAVIIFGCIAFMYSGAITRLGDWWYEHIFFIEKDRKNISKLHSSYPAYAEKLRFEALPPEEQHRILEEKKREEEERARWRKEEEKRRNDRVVTSMTGWTWSPTDDTSSGGLTNRDHDDLDMLQNMMDQHFSDGM